MAKQTTRQPRRRMRNPRNGARVPASASVVVEKDSSRLALAASCAHAAEAAGDEAATGEAWRRYRLIKDALRDPDELLVEGIALSEAAIELASASRNSL